MTVFGIDLGTSYSCIVRNDGSGSVAPVELLNADGKKFIPSVVTYDKKTGQPKVGKTGQACLLTRPECTKAFVKREMNREFCEKESSVDGIIGQIATEEEDVDIVKH